MSNSNKTKIYEVGFASKGKFSYTDTPIIWSSWNNMLCRAYSEIKQNKHPTYIGCTVSESWWNLQNFGNDYLQMSGHSQGWDLDKDLLVKGNKIYSKETCCLLPRCINTLFNRHVTSRRILPTGVSLFGTGNNKYRANCYINGKACHFGCFPTVELAFQAYKKAKESEIKRLADLFKFQLDPRVYKALVNYNVEIID